MVTERSRDMVIERRRDMVIERSRNNLFLYCSFYFDKLSINFPLNEQKKLYISTPLNVQFLVTELVEFVHFVSAQCTKIGH